MERKLDEIFQDGESTLMVTESIAGCVNCKYDKKIGIAYDCVYENKKELIGECSFDLREDGMDVIFIEIS
jgi:hypothetical protein